MLVWLVAALGAVAGAQSSLRRCYSCRSRGGRGDCRDTFIRPGTRPAGAGGGPVVEEPCSTGWCRYRYRFSVQYVKKWITFQQNSGGS